MRRESVLTDSDKDSIEIVKFIFHIIIEDETYILKRSKFKFGSKKIL